MPRSPRTRLGPGLYADASGWAAIARAAGQRKEKRFPAGTPREQIRHWQRDTAQQLREAATQRTAALPPGSLAADAARYLTLLPAHQRKERTYLLAPWLGPLGSRPRHTLTPADLRAVEATWTDVTVSTLRHRRRALAGLYRALDGEDAEHPVARLPTLRQPHQPVRAIPWHLAEAIVAGMGDRGRPRKGAAVTAWDKSKSKVRLRLLLYTGLPPATIKRLRPHDVHLEEATVTVPPRRKGSGAPPATLPLLPKAVAAFRDWLRLSAWGDFSTRSLGQAFSRAVAKARQTHPDIPADMRAYDLRHSFLSMVLERTGDLAAVRELGQHASMQTTLRYTQRAASPRARAAIETVARQGGTAPPSSRKS